MELSVVLPCLDESETLAVCVDKALGAIERLSLVGEVIVADNGSVDGSREIAVEHGARLVQVDERGYGAAIAGGVVASRAVFVIVADADASYDLENLEPFVTALRDGADLVMGNRFQGGIAPGAMPMLHRYLGNPVLSGLGRILFKAPVGDFHCGMRGFRRASILGLNLRTRGMEYASEMVVAAVVRGLDVREVPTTLRPDGRTRAPHLRTWRDGWRHLRFLLALSPRWLLLYPALALTLLGGLGFTAVALGPRDLGGISLDVHTLVAAATAVIVGVQLGGMALVSRAYCAVIGVLPTSSRLDRLVTRLTLEKGLGAGSAFAVAGFGFFVASLLHWKAADFGPLDVAATMRLMLTGMLLIVVGMQVVTVSYMLSMTHVGDA